MVWQIIPHSNPMAQWKLDKRFRLPGACPRRDEASKVGKATPRLKQLVHSASNRGSAQAMLDEISGVAIRPVEHP